MRSLHNKILKAGLIDTTDDVVVIQDRRPKPPVTEESPAEELAMDHSMEDALLEETRERGEALYAEYMQRAHDDSEELLNKMRQLAVEEHDQAVEETQREIQQLKEQGFQEGYAAGLQQCRGMVEQMHQDLGKLFTDVQLRQQQFMQSYAQSVQDYALEIAAKIMAHEIMTDQTALYPLVESAIKSVRDVEWMTVRISNQSPELVAQLEEVFRPGQRVEGKRIEIVPSDLPPGSCIIDTPVGQIDASAATQIENLRQYFAKL